MASSLTHFIVYCTAYHENLKGDLQFLLTSWEAACTNWRPINNDWDMWHVRCDIPCFQECACIFLYLKKHMHIVCVFFWPWHRIFFFERLWHRLLRWTQIMPALIKKHDTVQSRLEGVFFELENANNDTRYVVTPLPIFS